MFFPPIILPPELHPRWTYQSNLKYKMAETKHNRTVEIIKDEKAPQVVQTQSKAEFAALIGAYAKKNPVKYELKKKALEAKLSTL